MRSKDYEERRRKILFNIIRTYIETAKPVASKALVYRYRLKVSPATVRNIMAELEELGYLTHPHTSAGRIPTDKGLRYYVDLLMQEERITPYEKRRILSELLETQWAELEELLAKSAEVISELTDEAGLLFYAGARQTVLRGVNLIPLSENKLLFIMIGDTGEVHHVFVETRELPAQNKVEKFLRFINEELKDETVLSLKSKIKSRFLVPEYPFYSIFYDLLKLFLSALEKIEKKYLYLEGTSKVLMKPEFQDIERAKLLLNALEEKKEIIRILEQDLYRNEINIHIGEENPCPKIHDCSIITAKYRIGQRSLGTIGVLGPKRMAYGRIISILRYMADILGEAMETSLF